MSRNITPTKEDYLRAIYLATQGKKNLRTVRLARQLKLAKSTVSERVRELARQGLIHHRRYSTLGLTKKGRRIATRLTYKHRIIEVFLHIVLKMPKNHVHREAHKLEHAFSDEVIFRLGKFLGNPKRDPHGKSLTGLS